MENSNSDEAHKYVIKYEEMTERKLLLYQRSYCQKKQRCENHYVLDSNF